MRFPVRSDFLTRPVVMALLGAVTVWGLVMSAGEVTLHSLLQDRASKRQLETLSHATTLRVLLERELAALLNRSNGLAAYLAVRNKQMETREVQAILAELHRNSRHIRNFGVAEGYRLKYVYPLKGNERAVGVYYPDLPGQWPMIQAIVGSGQPALAGPVDLAQGGRGLIYRMPLAIDGRYWGLLSTVIDSDSLFSTVVADSANTEFEFAIRGKDGRGLDGGPVWGALSLFEAPDVVVQEMEVPGGRWAIGVRSLKPDSTALLAWFLHAGSALAGLVVAVMLFLLMRSRSLMTQRALYDDLTRLPNRRLFEDRALMAFSRRQRQQGQLCALLFLDLDDFKGINDRHGHKVGDAVLQAVAQRALAAVRKEDTVARWGGDEFIVLLEHVTPAMLETIVQRLRGSVQVPIASPGGELRLGVSIGVAIYPDNGRDLDELLHAADSHMYSDKIRRKNGAPPLAQ